MSEEKNEIKVYTDELGKENFEKALQTEVDESGVEIVEANDPELEALEEEALQFNPTNIPYEKIYNQEGELANPITKGDPYLNPFMNRREKKRLIRKATKHPKNNKKGVRLIVTKFARGKFVKTYVEKQVTPEGKVIIHNRMKLK